MPWSIAGLGLSVNPGYDLFLGLLRAGPQDRIWDGFGERYSLKDMEWEAEGEAAEESHNTVPIITTGDRSSGCLTNNWEPVNLMSAAGAFKL